ncbi:related to acetyl-hydrolase [Serendipita indica DSM 11827]|uniref:Related to acetyl-hydrolase n=1 Tax=Serendipita indica (strain DSM 11827) TaxID=1109443 RepID=G4TGU0_SERID|nr:related to acetyl-hydrolase [Serendipita indica DSM 11827]
MPASLTTEMSLRGPQVLLGALTKHYFGSQDSGSAANDELLYASAFRLFKSFLEASSKHTVEELQEFSNIRTPSPYWVHSPRVLVPLVCCELASKHIITALGGEESAKKILGGIKWWQVRGIKGVDCQWIALAKDWQEAKRRRKEQESIQKFDALTRKGKGPATANEPAEKPTEEHAEAEYTAEMDDMRCMLYFHGGGYYFGSIDQQRFVLQRYARKMNGRVFAVNYRKAPQYPFPCAIQDCLAAYIFLIQPPEGAKHKPIPPSSIVIAGDSAGGGLALAVLQAIRDSGLPAPAGGILISPWCDLTHSFPSIHQNTATDILPPTGLSMHKPSLLWPPPNEEVTKTVRNNLAEKIRRLTRLGHSRSPSHDSVVINSRGDVTLGSPAKSNYGSVGLNASMTHLKAPSGNHSAASEYGMRPSTSAPAISNLHHVEPSDTFTICIGGTYYQVKSQIQLYTTNNLLTNPLVSPVNGYLGGLPPLFIMASDKEVLRDEIIYVAHKAAHPDRFPTRPGIRVGYPLLDGIKERHPAPTQVHLQVYDDTCHVLPLFTFTTPAKFAFRSVANFCKHVMPDKGLFSTLQPDLSLASFGDSNASNSPLRRNTSTSVSRTPSFRLGSLLGRNNSFKSNQMLSPTADVAGPRFQRDSADGGPGTAGDPEVYKTKPLSKGMIRERVSTTGIIREMEPEEDLPALAMTLDSIGMVNELSVKRYLDAQTVWEKRFKETLKSVGKHRKRHIDAAEQEDNTRFSKLKATVLSKEKDDDERNKVLNSTNWSWAWVVAGDENPPPSSIVARRDTAEARRLSKFADEAVEAKESRMSGNNFWQMIVNTLTKGPEHTIQASSPTMTKSPTTWTSPVEPPEPSSPPRSIFRAAGLRSTSSLATSISNDVVRIRRPSFGSLRIGKGRYVDANGETMQHRQSIVSELPPALPSVGGLGRDDTFTKLALEGIAEVRVSEELTRPVLNVDTSKVNGTTSRQNTTPASLSNGKGPGGLSPIPGSALTPKRSASGLVTPVKRKAIPAQLLEEAGIDPSQSPYASKESLGKHSNSSQPKLSQKESVSALSNNSSGVSNTNGIRAPEITPLTPVVPTTTPGPGEEAAKAGIAAEKVSEAAPVAAAVN